ncbi:hypothetical protein [Shimia sp.]|uniref:hypothetical protein n=1 Tax=Shimia sp. TaxID=1954381 RepID=UPI0035685B42
MTRNALSAICILFSSPVQVVANEGIAHCLTMKDNELRLSCYDDVAGYSEPVQVDDEATTPWTFVEQSDDFTNKNTSFISLTSDMAEKPMTDAPEALIVRCDGWGGTEVFVVTGGYIGSRNDFVPVRYKFGNNDPITERWHESTKGTAVFLPNGYRDFRKGLESGEDFIFEVTDYRGSREKARFKNGPLTGKDFQFVWKGCKLEN